MARSRARLLALWIGATVILAGSALAAIAASPASGSVNTANSVAASAAGGPTFTADQGAAGSTPWPVTGTVNVGNLPATQQVSGTVGVSNFPSAQAVTGTVGIDSAHNTVRIDAAGSIPATAFSIPPLGISAAPEGDPNESPDPSGTRYAITSVVVTNTVSQAVEVDLGAGAFSPAGLLGNGCAGLGDQVASVPGPDLIVGPDSTLVVNYPQPFITAPVTGGLVCLIADSGTPFVGVTWSAVGYRL